MFFINNNLLFTEDESIFVPWLVFRVVKNDSLLRVKRFHKGQSVSSIMILIYSFVRWLLGICKGESH